MPIYHLEDSAKKHTFAAVKIEVSHFIQTSHLTEILFGNHPLFLNLFNSRNRND
ncbi:MAG: hypothetical protein K0S09_3070 [Sphingobacteriaceae bacterium]|jgi:hypothetical protein|nr:hypothetical protein [Sphingobacteriaceae bacterium]